MRRKLCLSIPQPYTFVQETGGNGAVTFRREKYVAAGGPDGGDGGRGGNVVFVPNDGINTLADFRYRRKFIAQSGQPGGGKRCAGKAGADILIKVPRGTLIYDSKSGRLLADMSGDNPFTAAKGGRGGMGQQPFCHIDKADSALCKAGHSRGRA